MIKIREILYMVNQDLLVVFGSKRYIALISYNTRTLNHELKKLIEIPSSNFRCCCLSSEHNKILRFGSNSFVTEIKLEDGDCLSSFTETPIQNYWENYLSTMNYCWETEMIVGINS